jgi:hypothetical protein
MSNVIVWDIETVPDLQGSAAANGHVGKSDDEVRAELGDKFPKHIYHSIICIGALVAHREDGGHWIVDALGAPHVGERPEKELIASFVEKSRPSHKCLGRLAFLASTVRPKCWICRGPRSPPEDVSGRRGIKVRGDTRWRHRKIA